jgi:hypothetical protein
MGSGNMERRAARMEQKHFHTLVDPANPIIIHKFPQRETDAVRWEQDLVHAVAAFLLHDWLEKQSSHQHIPGEG